MRSRRLVGAAVALLLAPVAACAPVRDGGDATTDGAWTEGQRRGAWTLVYSGYGEASAESGEGGDHVRLGPTAAADHDVTHGALAVDDAAPADLRLTGRVTTELQRREGTPNPWEVGWFLWRYTDPDHFYALALKPNGWELSKQDPAYPGKQRFLATGDAPASAVGSTHEVEIVAVGPTVTVRIDGDPIVTVTDTERPYLTGGVALYTEDAVVDFAAVRHEPATQLPAWAPPAVVGATGRGGAAPSSGASPTSATSAPAGSGSAGSVAPHPTGRTITRGQS